VRERQRQRQRERQKHRDRDREIHDHFSFLGLLGRGRKEGRERGRKEGRERGRKEEIILKYSQDRNEHASHTEREGKCILQLLDSVRLKEYPLPGNSCYCATWMLQRYPAPCSPSLPQLLVNRNSYLPRDLCACRLQVKCARMHSHQLALTGQLVLIFLTQG
jgi:hypothetical protein